MAFFYYGFLFVVREFPAASDRRRPFFSVYCAPFWCLVLNECVGVSWKMVINTNWEMLFVSICRFVVFVLFFIQ
jgi:hypothetical protein